MDHSTGYLDDAIYFLVAAVIVALICKRIKMSSVVGYIVAGVLIGPHVLGSIVGVDGSRLLAEWGVVFLLFTIGLELPWERLQELRKQVFAMGALQVLLTGAFFSTIIFFLGASLEAAVLIGSGLALSSTAVVLQVLSDRKEMNTKYGRSSFSILLFQDLAVVLLLVWLSLLDAGEKSFMSVLWQAMLRAIVVLIVITVVGRFLLRPLYRVVAATKVPEIFVALTLLVVIATSAATSSAGLSPELGAFIAGLLLAETEYRHQVEADILPFKGILLGLFFMTVGMSIEPSLMMQEPWIIARIVLTLVIAKVIITGFVTLLFSIPLKNAIRVGLLLSSGSEFVFVLFRQAAQAGIITFHFSQLIFIAIVISMAITPLLAILGKHLSGKFGKEVGVALIAAEQEAADLKGHIILIGFGRVGKTTHHLLMRQHLNHVVVDLDMKRVAEGRNESFPVFFGDARRLEVLRALGADRAKALIITVGYFPSAFRVCSTVRKEFPSLEIFARVRDSQQAYEIRQTGAHPVMPETYAPSFQLASAVFELCGISTDQADKTIEVFRKEYLSPESFAGGKVPWVSSSVTDIPGEK